MMWGSGMLQNTFNMRHQNRSQVTYHVAIGAENSHGIGHEQYKTTKGGGRSGGGRRRAREALAVWGHGVQGMSWERRAVVEVG